VNFGQRQGDAAARDRARSYVSKTDEGERECEVLAGVWGSDSAGWKR